MSSLRADRSLRRGAYASRDAFTLIELLVVIAIIAILASVLLPVLQQAMIRGATATCINNQKELATAWLMYAADNSDACAGNNWRDEQTWLSYPKENWVSGWLGADGSGGDGTGGGKGGPDNTNTTILLNPTYATLGDYSKVPKIYLCPASKVLAPVISGGRPQYLMCRSVSMSCWMGYNCLPPGANQGHPLPDYSGLQYKVFPKTSTITAGIGPADAFVFMEERAESIDDGSFETDPASGNVVPNWPTDYHDGAATIGFADGHVDVHRWFNTLTSLTGVSFTTPQQAVISTKWGAASVSIKQIGDIAWLNQHATCKK